MTGVTPGLKHLGRELLAHEAAGSASSADLVAAADAVLQKLQARLVLYFGQEGFYRLLGRALHMVKGGHPLLAAVEAEPLPSHPAARVQLRGLRESAAANEPAEVREALATLIGSLIWLLARFIGWDITRSELRRAWPAFSFPEAGPGAEETKQ